MRKSPRDPYETWLKPIEAAYAGLDAKLKNFTVQGRFFNKDDLAGKPPGKRELVYTFEFSRLGNFVKSTRKVDRASDRSIHAAANDSYFFAVGDNAPGELRSLLDLGERADFKLRNLRRRPTLRPLLADATGPLGNFGFPIESPLAVLKHNAHRLRAQEATLAGRKVLLLEGDFERFSDKTGMSDLDVTNYSAPNSRIYLDPALDYRVVRWEFKMVHRGRTTDYTDTYEYDHAVDGYPLLSKYAMRAGTETVGYSTMEAEFTDWRLNENKPAEFRLSHFGLKEPNYGSKSFLSGWMWLLLIGAALVTVGVWFYRRMPSKPG